MPFAQRVVLPEEQPQLQREPHLLITVFYSPYSTCHSHSSSLAVTATGVELQLVMFLKGGGGGSHEVLSCLVESGVGVGLTAEGLVFLTVVQSRFTSS